MKLTKIGFILIVFIIILFNNCKKEICDPTITLGSGKIKPELMNTVPYQNGDTLKLIHSAGQIINFNIERITTNVEKKCNDCCNKRYLDRVAWAYEENKTFLTPDYPIFDMMFYISNRSEYADVTWVSSELQIGNNKFIIPKTYLEDYEQNISIDSVLISNKYYYDVFEIANESHEGGTIYPKIIYYNYTKGILKINMSNEEYYEIYE